MSTKQDRTAEYALIEEHFPDAMINEGDAFMDSPGKRYNLHGIIGFCGCGMPVGAAEWLLKYMEKVEEAKYSVGRFDEILADGGITPDSHAHYTFMYWLEDREWTEHGTSIDGAWITDKGKAAIVALRFFIEDPGE